jgi:chaperonin cofactor prefoldin
MGVVNPMFQPSEHDWAVDRREFIEQNHRRGVTALWIVVLVLAVALGASAFYGYFAWKKQNIQLGQLFGSQGTVTTLGQRLDTAEAKLQELSSGWEGIGGRVTKLEAKVQSDLGQSRKYAEALSQQLHQQISAELDARTSPLDARLRQVESEQTAQRSQVAQVEADLRQNISQQIASVREDTGRDISGVRQQTETNSHDVSALSQRLDRQRVDFELAKGQTKELVPGISLRISETNPLYQRYRASLWLFQDRATLWLREQTVHEPVRFFQKDGGEPYELVVTDVTKKTAVGYLLVPFGQDAGVPRQQAAIGVSTHE